MRSTKSKYFLVVFWIFFNFSLDLYWQVNMEPDFTACFLCIASKGVDLKDVTSFFEQIRNTYVEVEYIRSAVLSATLNTLPQFQKWIDREMVRLLFF